VALNTATIKKRLASAPWKQKDNEAQSIINKATPAELKSLDVEGILRLFEALAMLPPRVYSSNDKAAMRKLKAHTRFQPIVRTPDFGVDLVKKARLGSPVIQSQLTPQLVTRIYAAEKKRLSLPERIGIDDATIGRGQVSQKAYEEAKKKKHFESTLVTCLARVVLSNMLQNAPRRPPMIEVDFRTYKILIPERYSTILSYPPVLSPRQRFRSSGLSCRSPN